MSIRTIMTSIRIVLCALSISCLQVSNSLAQVTNAFTGNAVSQRVKSAETRNVFIKSDNKMDPQDLPAAVDITIVQRQYLAKVLASVLKIIEEGASLESQELVLGRGEFSWPKDPKKPTKVSINFTSKNFEMRSISLNFSRKNQASAWSKAEILVIPPNFPRGVYSQNLPTEILNDYVLDKSYVAEHEHGPITRTNAFEYKHKSNSNNSRIRIEAREDVSTLDDNPPKSFYLLSIIKT